MFVVWPSLPGKDSQMLVIGGNLAWPEFNLAVEISSTKPPNLIPPQYFHLYSSEEFPCKLLNVQAYDSIYYNIGAMNAKFHKSFQNAWALDVFTCTAELS